MSYDAEAERVALVRERAGDRIHDIELYIRVFYVSVTDDRAGDIAGVASMIGVDPLLVERSPFALVGSTAAIVVDLARRREELGFRYVVVGPYVIVTLASVVAALAGH